MELFADKNLIGVCIGSRTLKIVKLKSGSGTPVLKAAFSVSIPSDDAERAAISTFLKDALKGHKVQGKRAATVLSGSELISRQLSLPVMPDKDLREAVIWEMRKETGISADELVTDYTASATADKDNKLSVAAFATKKSEASSIFATFKDAGLELRLLSVPSSALLTVFNYNNDWEKGVNYAFLTINGASSTLLIASDGKIRFTREITFGGDDITSTISAGLGMDNVEAEEYKRRYGLDVPVEDAESVGIAMRSLVERLCVEIYRSIDYFQAQFRGGAVSNLFIGGGCSLLIGIDDFIAETIGISCFKHDPFKKIKISSSLDPEAISAIAPSLNVATGLALSRQ